MPYSKDIGKYPAQFISLIDAKLPLRWECRDEKQARHFRFLLYGFIEALKVQNHPGAKVMNAMLFRVEGRTLVITQRDDDAALKALDEILMTQMMEQSPSIQPPAPEPPPTEPYQSHTEDYIEKTYGRRETPIAPEPCNKFVYGPFGDRCYKCGHGQDEHSPTIQPAVPPPMIEEKK